MPKCLSKILTTGAKQLVVQDAFETTSSVFTSYFSSLTPMTNVLSTFFPGAVMMTFFAPASKWRLAPSFELNFPVASIAISRSEEHTSELQSRGHIVCRLLLETKTYG